MELSGQRVIGADVLDRLLQSTCDRGHPSEQSCLGGVPNSSGWDRIGAVLPNQSVFPDERAYLRRPFWPLLPASVLIAAFATHVAGEARQNDSITTMDRVYTAVDAKQGEEMFMNLCAGCHTSAQYAGQAFRTTWRGRFLSELYTQINDNMPKNEPGTLTPRESASLVAYILKINGIPAGSREIPTDLKLLKKIRIETPMPSERKSPQSTQRDRRLWR